MPPDRPSRSSLDCDGVKPTGLSDGQSSQTAAPCQPPRYRRPGSLHFEPEESPPCRTRMSATSHGSDSGCDTGPGSPLGPEYRSADQTDGERESGMPPPPPPPRGQGRRSGAHQRRLKGTAVTESLPAPDRSFEGFLQQLEVLKDAGGIVGDAAAPPAVEWDRDSSSPAPPPSPSLSQCGSLASIPAALARECSANGAEGTPGSPRGLRRLSDGELMMASAAELMAQTSGRGCKKHMSTPSPGLARVLRSVSSPGEVVNGAPNDDNDPLMPTSKSRGSRRSRTSTFRGVLRGVFHSGAPRRSASTAT